jgi:hypothetical protein
MPAPVPSGCTLVGVLHLQKGRPAPQLLMPRVVHACCTICWGEGPAGICGGVSVHSMMPLPPLAIVKEAVDCTSGRETMCPPQDGCPASKPARQVRGKQVWCER